MAGGNYGVVGGAVAENPLDEAVTITAATYTITATDEIIYIDASSNTVDLTLPTAVGRSGKVYRIKAINLDNAATVDGDGSETIDGAADFTFESVNDSLDLQSDGANWQKVTVLEKHILNDAFGGGWTDTTNGASRAALKAKIDAMDTATSNAQAEIDAAVTDTGAGAGNANKLLELDGDGKLDGRDVGADGAKLDGIEAGADVTDATNVDAAGAVMNSDTSTAEISFVIDEDDMSSDSATKVPTQQSVKAHVASKAFAYVGGNVANDTEDTALSLTDAYQVNIMTNAGNRSYTMPSVDSSNIGVIYRFAKRGAGHLYIFANDSDTFLFGSAESESGGGVKNTTTETGAYIEVKLLTATKWIVINQPTGTWAEAAAPSDLLTGLVEHWSMDESSGNRVGLHNGYVLTDFNTVGSTTGKISNASVFVKANSELLYHTSTIYNFQDTSFSLTGWLMQDATDASNNRTFLAYNEDGTNNVSYYAYIGNTGGANANKIVFECAGQAVVSAALSLSTWHHFHLFHDAENDLIGLVLDDGTPVTAATGGTAPTSRPSGSLFLGALRSDVSTSMLDGKFDEFMIHSKRLSSGEITASYNSGSGLAYPYS